MLPAFAASALVGVVIVLPAVADGRSLRPTTQQRASLLGVGSDHDEERKPWHPRFVYATRPDGSLSLERKASPPSGQALPPAFLQVQSSHGPRTCDCDRGPAAKSGASDTGNNPPSATISAAPQVARVPEAAPQPKASAALAFSAPAVDLAKPFRDVQPSPAGLLQEASQWSRASQESQGTASRQEQLLSSMRQKQVSAMRAAESDLQRQQGQLQQQMAQIQRQMTQLDQTAQREEALLGTPPQQGQFGQSMIQDSPTTGFNQMPQNVAVQSQPWNSQFPAQQQVQMQQGALRQQVPYQQSGQMPPEVAFPQVMQANVPQGATMMLQPQAFMQQQPQAGFLQGEPIISQQPAFPPSSPFMMQPQQQQPFAALQQGFQQGSMITPQQAALIQQQEQQAAFMRSNEMMAQQAPLRQQAVFPQGNQIMPPQMGLMQFPQQAAWQGGAVMYR